MLLQCKAAIAVIYCSSKLFCCFNVISCKGIACEDEPDCMENRNVTPQTVTDVFFKHPPVPTDRIRHIVQPNFNVSAHSLVDIERLDSTLDWDKRNSNRLRYKLRAL